MAVVAKQHESHLLFRIHKIEVYCFTGNNAIEKYCLFVVALRSIPFAKHKDDSLIFEAYIFLFFFSNFRQTIIASPNAHIFRNVEYIMRQLPTFADARVIWNCNNVWHFIFVNRQNAVFRVTRERLGRVEFHGLQNSLGHRRSHSIYPVAVRLR